MRPDESPASKMLARLEKVKETGRDQWLARCPAHEDGHPSLSVREAGDQTLLLHCFAGCGAADIVAAVGLRLGDLFPNPGSDQASMRRGLRRPPLIHALEALDHEAHVVAVIASDVLSQRRIDEPTWQRLRTAATRIGAAREAAR